MIRPRSFHCDMEPQLTSADTVYSVILWVYSFDSLLSARKAGKGLPFSLFIGFHDNLMLIS